MRTRLAALALTLPLGLAALTACEDDTSASTDASVGSEAGDAGDSGGELPDVAEGEEISAEELSALMIAAFEKATTADLVMSKMYFQFLIMH